MPGSTIFGGCLRQQLPRKAFLDIRGYHYADAPKNWRVIWRCRDNPCLANQLPSSVCRAQNGRARILDAQIRLLLVVPATLCAASMEARDAASVILDLIDLAGLDAEQGICGAEILQIDAQ